MTTPRKRISSEFSQNRITEVTETPEEKILVPEIPEITETPAENAGYVETFAAPVEHPEVKVLSVVEVKEEKKITPVLLNKPKRHPRNVPKFSGRV